MTILGLLLLIVGIGAAGLLFTGGAPMFLANLPIPLYAWIALAVVGGVMILLNRRPND